MKNVLTIAGSDPSGWAGVQADLGTFGDFGVRGLSVITAITVQTGREVRAVHPVSPALVTRQTRTLLDEFEINALKIGMLARADTVKAVTRLVRSTTLGKSRIVLDPVMLSSSGHPLLDKKGREEMRRLLPLVTVVTPNTDEAGALTGLSIRDTWDMEEAAKMIADLGAGNVVITGGHLEGAPVDILYDGRKFTCFKGRRIKGKTERFHGTGCVFSSAVAAGLARGMSVKKAVDVAKGYVNKVLKRRS